MSKQDKYSEPMSEDKLEVATESPAEQDSASVADDVQPHKTRRASIWILTIIALLVAGGSVYLIKPTLLDDTAAMLNTRSVASATESKTVVQTSSVPDEVLALPATVASSEAQTVGDEAVKTTENVPEIVQLATVDLDGFYLEKIAPKMQALTQEIQSLQEHVRDLQVQNQSLQNELAALTNLSNEQYALRQIEYFLNLAKSELNLARNPYTASQALEAALVIANRHTSLTALAEALSSDLVAVKLAQSKGIEHVYAQTRVLAVALQQASLMTPENLPAHAQNASDSAQDLPWWKEVWQDIVNVFDSDWGGLVKVEKISSADKALLDLSQSKLLRHTMAMTIRLAQQALVSGNQEIWQSSLTDIIDNLQHFYYMSDELTQEALRLAQDLSKVSILPKLPDLHLSQQAFEQTQAILNKE